MTFSCTYGCELSPVTRTCKRHRRHVPVELERVPKGVACNRRPICHSNIPTRTGVTVDISSAGASLASDVRSLNTVYRISHPCSNLCSNQMCFQSQTRILPRHLPPVNTVLPWTNYATQTKPSRRSSPCQSAMLYSTSSPYFPCPTRRLLSNHPSDPQRTRDVRRQHPQFRYGAAYTRTTPRQTTCMAPHALASRTCTAGNLSCT